MNTIQRIIKNTAALLISSVVVNLLNFTAVVYLARVLNPGNFGKINFAIAVVAYFTLIANLGLPLFGTREIARERQRMKEYMGNIVTLRLCMSLLGLAALFILTIFLNKPFEIKCLLVLYGLILIPSAFLLDWVFQGAERMEYIGISRVTGGVVNLGLLLIIVKSSKQLLFVPGIYVISELLVVVVMALIFTKNFGKLKLTFSISSWKNILRRALPIGLSLFMAQIFYNIDTVMLGFMRKDEEVGYYNAAYKIIMFLILLIGAYHDAVFPLISRYLKTSLESLSQLLRQTAKIMSILALPLAVGGTILAGHLISLVFGEKYLQGVAAFQILIWAVFIICLNTGYSRGLFASNKVKWYLAGTIIPAIVNVAANFILIPLWGIKGAAIATVAAEAVGFWVMYTGFKAIVHVSFWRYIIRPFFASIVMFLFIYWGIQRLNLNLFSLVTGSIVIYGVSLYLIKGVEADEIKLVFSTLLRNYGGWD
ncbi:MAG: oligosaccharide flippase family protein [Candidatus Omnitrophota bacterium]